MPSSANQYPRDFTTRAELGSDLTEGPPQRTANGHRTDIGVSGLYGPDWQDPEVQDPSWMYRASVNPVAGTDGYLYPRTIDIPSEQPSEGHNSHGLASAITSNPNAHPQHNRSTLSVTQPNRSRGQP
jgi:hypothetical protein